MMSDAVKAVILGIIEGITEFLPVSSTGHMLLAQRFFGLGEGAFWQSFVILIQLGAILAIVMLYFFKLWRVALGMFSNPDDRRFVIGVLQDEPFTWLRGVSFVFIWAGAAVFAWGAVRRVRLLRRGAVPAG